MFRNILVSIDGSTHADQALAEAIDIAIGSGARLTLLASVPDASPWLCTPATAGASASIAAELEREFKEVVRTAVSQVPDTVPVTTILTHEPIRNALVHRSETGNHDLLVMGSRGRRSITSSLLGSVSHYALNHCKIPVLIVHADVAAEPARTDPRDVVSSA